MTALERFLQTMYWTGPTALFFGAIAGTLLLMTLLQAVRPTTERRGFLPIPTTRGDRLFVGLLGAAWVHLAWLAFAASLPLPWGSALAALWFVLVMAFG